MIFTPRSESTNETCTMIEFRGYRISIAMDDRSRGGNTPLTRSWLIVTKDGEEVTQQFAGCHNTNNGAIEEVEGETLFEVMQAIANHEPAKIYNILCITTRDAGDVHVNLHQRPPARTAKVAGSVVNYNGRDYPLKYFDKGLCGSALLIGLVDGPGVLELYTDTPMEGSSETPDSLREMADRAMARR